MPLTVKVRDVMDKRVVAVVYMATVDEAVKKMLQNNVWSLVVERKGAPWGVVTERDVIRRCIARGLSTATTSVGSISTAPIVTISPDASMREAMDSMAAREIRRLFVVENGRIIGRVTQTEVFQSTIDVMETLTSLSNVQ